MVIMIRNINYTQYVTLKDKLHHSSIHEIVNECRPWNGPEGNKRDNIRKYETKNCFSIKINDIMWRVETKEKENLDYKVIEYITK